MRVLRLILSGVVMLLVFYSLLFYIEEQGFKWGLDFDDPPAYQDKSVALDEAAQGLGRRWPGTTVEVADQGEDRATVERSWLGLREGSVEIRKTDRGWIVTTYGESGPGARVQEGILILVAVLVAWGFLRLTRPRRGRSATLDPVTERES